jgi:hypothetical protein
MTIAALQAQRDSILEQMRAESRVEFTDRAVTYRPQAEMDGAIQRIDAEIAKLQSSQNRQFIEVLAKFRFRSIRDSPSFASPTKHGNGIYAGRRFCARRLILQVPP